MMGIARQAGAELASLPARAGWYDVFRSRLCQFALRVSQGRRGRDFQVRNLALPGTYTSGSASVVGRLSGDCLP